MDTRLEEINNHREDHQWLRAHLDEVYDVVRQAVNQSDSVHRATATLLNIYPFLLKTDDIKRWLEVLLDALLGLMKFKDNVYLMQVWEKVGQAYTLVGEPRRAGRAFQSALNRAYEGNDPKMMVHAFIGLFKVQMFRPDENFNDEMVARAVALTAALDDPELQAELDYAIACAYMHRREFPIALEYAQQSYKYWEQQGNKEKMAQLAFNCAIIYRDDNQIEQANAYLEQARQLYLETGDERQYGLVAYEQGAICRQQGDYAAAVDWYALALSEFEQLKPPFYHIHYIGIAHEAIGNALALSQEYARAQKHLLKAREIWEKFDQMERLVGNYISVAYVMGKLGHIPYAKSCLTAAGELCKALPDSKARERQEQLIAQSWKELNEASLLW